MSERILVASRKGLFVLARKGGEWQIERNAFLGDNVTLTLTDARDGAWYAALNLGHFGVKLHRSRDRGASWQEIAVPAYGPDDRAASGDGKPPAPAALSLIWALEAGGPDEPGRLWAGTIPGGLFRSDDHGDSWQLVRSLWDLPERMLWFGGGYDHPGIHSICVDPRDARTLRVAISCGGVWCTLDSGASWSVHCEGMRADYMPPERQYDPVIQDPHRMVQCRAAPDRLWVQHHCGIFVSGDGARNWRAIEHAGPSVFGFAVAVHPHEPDTAWFVPAIKDQFRVPVDARFVVTRTRDGGASFDVLDRGLPQQPAYDLVYRHGLAVDERGSSLALGTTTGGLWTSADGGDQWQALDARLPPISAVAFV
jgi:hypothetical protein